MSPPAVGDHTDARGADPAAETPAARGEPLIAQNDGVDLTAALPYALGQSAMYIREELIPFMGAVQNQDPQQALPRCRCPDLPPQ
jgi:hypothetical protein